MTTPTRDAPSEVSHQIRGSALLLTGSILSAGVDFAAQILLVRHLSKLEFGAWSYALAIVVLFATIAQLEMRQAVARFLPVYLERNDRPRALGAIAIALGVVLGLGIFLALGIIVLINVLGFRPTNDPESLRLLGLIAFLVPINAIDGVFTGLFAAFGASRTIFIRQSLLAPALRLGLVVLLIASGADMTPFAVGYVAVSLLGVLLYVAALRGLLHREGLIGRRDDPGEGSRAMFPTSQMLVFVFPLLTSTLVWVLMESSDALLLGYFHNAEAVASFRVILPLARMNQLVVTTFSVLYLPLAARMFAKGAITELAELYWRTAGWMTVLTFPLLLLTSVFAPVVVTSVYGSAYSGSSTILAVLAAAYFFQTVTGFNGLTLKIHNRLGYMVVVDVSMSALNVVVNLLLIPTWGALGAAIGTSMTLLLHNVLKQVGLRRFTTIPAFPRDLIRLYGGIAVFALASVMVATILPSSLVVAIVISAGGGIVGLILGWPSLQVAAMFPEIRRFPLYTRLVHRGAKQAASAEDDP